MSIDWTKTTRDLHALTEEMLEKVMKVLDLTNNHGLDVLGIDSYRDPWTQARLYRKSRSRQEIEEKIDHLQSDGFPRLAAIIAFVGPQDGEYGKHVTNAAPGESWHQFGEAWDACPMFDSKRLLWEIKSGSPEFTRANIIWGTFGQCVREAGLIWAGDWTSFKEKPHCQLRTGQNPLDTFNPDEVERWAKDHCWW